MPVYEYECESCGGRFEAVRRFSDPELSECLLCKGKGVRKVLSAPAFVLKGSGWYVTDYARKGDPSPTGKKNKPAESSNQSSEKGSDSTPSAPTPSSGTSETK